MSIDLDASLLRQVRDILQEYAPNYEIWAFGSRVRKGVKPFADLDLAIISPKGISVRQLAVLANAFEESDLPIKVDLLDWNSTNPEFRKRIAEEHEVVFPESLSSAGDTKAFQNDR
jgi:predicted nucleotidyltransferase